MFSSKYLIALTCMVALVAAVPQQGIPHNENVATELPGDMAQNYAFVANGQNYVEVHNGLTERLGTHGFTLEAWVYNENPTADFDQPIVSHAEPGAPDVFHVDWLLQINRNTGRIAFVMGAGPGSYGFSLQGPALEFNEWTHVAVAVAAPHAGDPTSARLYVNGELAASATQWGGGAASRQITDAPIEIAHSAIGGAEQFYVGQLDEVRVWATVRSQAMIVETHKDPFLFADPAQIPEYLVGYYSFDAGPDDTVWDNSDQPWYDGTPMGDQERAVADGVVTIPLSPLNAPYAGPPAFALDFTGVHDQENFAQLPVDLSRALPRGFTFEAWVYLDAVDRTDHHYKTIVSRFSQDAADAQPGTFAAGSNPEADFVLQVDPRNGRLVFFMGGGRGQCEDEALGYGVALFSGTEQNVPAYEWTHVAFSVFSSSAQDPFSAKMYINGAEVVQSSDLPGNEWHAACHRNFLRFDPIYLGYYDNGFVQYWEGRIDEVRLWSEPRDDADIARDYIRPIPATTAGLLAYFLLNDGSGVDVRDSTTNQFDGKAIRPDWVLSQAPAELIDGVSGFPVHYSLQAQSPYPQYPNDDTFTYVVTHLPQSGGLFTTDTPIQLLEQVDVDTMRLVEEQLTYVSNIGFEGFDYFGYAAISALTGLMSETHYVYVHVAPYDVPGDVCVLDACGVCNGDGSSCVGGCDGKGGEIDVCGVCGGEGASCTCVYYKTFHTDELDCILFQTQINRTLARIENSVHTLHRTLTALETFDQSSWQQNWIDLGVPLEFLCGFLNGCLPPFEARLEEFEEEISGDLTLCEPVPLD